LTNRDERSVFQSLAFVAATFGMGNTPMTATRDIFAKNLRQLIEQNCDNNVSLTCREMGFNRTQFNRYLSGASWPRPDALIAIVEYFGVDANILLHEMGIDGLKTTSPKPVNLGFECGVRAAAIVVGEYCQQRIKKAEKSDGEAVFTKHTQHDIQMAILRRVLLGK
jgi:hypothetical protein